MQLFADDLAFLCASFNSRSLSSSATAWEASSPSPLPSAIPICPRPSLRSTPGSRRHPRSGRRCDFHRWVARADYRKVIGDYADAVLFLPTDDAKRRAHILAVMTLAPQHVMVSALEGGHAYDASQAKGRIVAPMLYIAADESPPRADIAHLRALVPRLYFGHVVGSGHFCQLEVPEQVNAMIDRFIALVAK